MSRQSDPRTLLDPKITVRLFPGDFARICRISEDTGLPVSFIARKAIRLYCDNRR
ncbi:hypothetical protein SAMN02745157_2821 [Kaistia soli DSM 19436]|uniref:Uncharacterized protein n=1 Tax=Kaistia soli DSM 19436 TaxID=1122133 RepID=A0A1M5DWV7_9HYPH|nr:hypothetical protein SAMN02745157_2821 [Kaistia soli DSM 19436]